MHCVSRYLVKCDMCVLARDDACVTPRCCRQSKSKSDRTAPKTPSTPEFQEPDLSPHQKQHRHNPKANSSRPRNPNILSGAGSSSLGRGVEYFLDHKKGADVSEGGGGFAMFLPSVGAGEAAAAAGGAGVTQQVE